MIQLPPWLTTSYTLVDTAILALVLIVPYYFFFAKPKSHLDTDDEDNNMASNPPSVMQPPRTDLAPPKSDPFTLDQLKAFDGSDEGKPIYVAIKGTVFDVSAKRDVYGPSGSYRIFAGKDGSKGLGLSSLKPEDAVSDWSSLDASGRKVLDDWHAFFSKRYNIVGQVVDLPEAVAKI